MDTRLEATPQKQETLTVREDGRRPPLGRGGAAASVPSPPSSPQLTVGTWFRLYSLALSRRLAMLLAMFIP